MKVYKNKKAQREIIRTYDNLLRAWGVEGEEKDVETTYGRAWFES